MKPIPVPLDHPVAGPGADTRSVQQHGPVPRTPHERDESADSQVADNPAAREVGRAAYADLAKGLVDTDKGPVMDATYDRMSGGESGKTPPRR